MSRFRRLAVWAGGAALLAATAIDTGAVLGRNLGLPIVGSIELIQAAVLVSGVLGLVLATADDDHARVRLLTDRIGRGRRVAEWFGPLSMALFFALVLAGSLWLAADLWDGHERSEVLGVSWRVLRLIANLGLGACVVVALATLFGRPRS